MTRPQLGVCFDRTFPPSSVVEFSERIESGGLDQLWIIEDCFYTTAVPLAATALARSQRLTVGLGILPAVARNPAITAMEIATLSNLAPGRLLAGIGHGVQSWMEQMGARTPSPLTTIEEVITVVRRLLRGETVSFRGREVRLDSVTLDRPPTKVPPVLAGVRGPKSMAVAGRVADGVVLAEGAGPAYIRAVREQAGAPPDFRISVFSALSLEDERTAAYRWMAPVVASWLTSPSPAIDAHPNGEEIRERFAEGGTDALAQMPREWWLQLGAIGTFDDAVEHLAMLAAAGADDIALFPCPDLQLARLQIDDAVRLAGALRASISG
jgi:alkanesulfonate monooxygenase SsuD/methylene tetrahydromethanopterin reductase-like flavin-dependent oxidoreductase (luciferase family)